MEYLLKRKMKYKEKHNKRYEKGQVCLMCDNCHQINIFDIDMKMDVKTKMANIHYLRNEIGFTCAHCYTTNKKDLYTDAIDPNIAITIENLNVAGYTTYFSCEGEYDRRAYISFGKLSNMSSEKALDIITTVSAMKYWYIDEEDISEYNKLIIRYIYENTDIEAGLQEVYEWSRSLLKKVQVED